MDDKYNYMLLSRLQMDCEYFLGYGNRCEKYLWGLTVQEHIKKMYDIYNTLPEKPDWITLEDINSYKEQMCG